MINEVSDKTGVSADLILSRDRSISIVCLRQLYWKLLREKKRYTFREIAELNGRDGSTIQLGIKRVNDLIQTGDKLACSYWDKIKSIEK